jgi:hypothetical protein
MAGMRITASGDCSVMRLTTAPGVLLRTKINLRRWMVWTVAAE